MYLSIFISQILLLIVTLHAGLVGSAAAVGVWRALPGAADNFSLRAFFALALGLALQIALLFVIGAAGGFYASVLIAVGVATGALALGYLWRAKPTPWPSRTEVLLAVAFYVVVVVNAVKVPGFFDDTLYHLPLARFYAETHGLGLDAWVRFPLFPQNIELLFALAFALRPGDFWLAQGFAALPAFVIALGLVGAGRWWRDSLPLGVAAGVAFLGLHVVDNSLGYAYIDAGLALFCFAAVLGVAVFAAKAPTGVYVALGILAGTAAGCKVHGLVLAAVAFAALAALRAKPSGLLAFAGATALFGCGWYVRSYMISGDPVSPAGGAWFGYFLWDAQDFEAQRMEQGVHGVRRSIEQLPGALIKAGANLVIPALLAPFVARRERAASYALWAVFLVYLLFWFYVSQVDRYLAPVLAIGILLSLTFVYDASIFLSRRFYPRGLEVAEMPAHISATIAVLLIVYGAYAFQRANDVLWNWDSTLNNRYGYAAFRKASSLEGQYGTRLMQIGFEGSTYFFDGTVIGDWFGPGRYRETVLFESPFKLIPAVKMRQAMTHFGAKMLAVNLKFAQFDEADYQTQFDILLDDGKQALLALKPAP